MNEKCDNFLWGCQNIGNPYFSGNPGDVWWFFFGHDLSSRHPVERSRATKSWRRRADTRCSWHPARSESAGGSAGSAWGAASEPGKSARTNDLQDVTRFFGAVHLGGPPMMAIKYLRSGFQWDGLPNVPSVKTTLYFDENHMGGHNAQKTIRLHMCHGQNMTNPYGWEDDIGWPSTIIRK